ncbi:hypothetical protein MP228_000678 [Amoeboaphelidium protococcarum]|nr:hypothetical protein MP228_005840 [Amoeboaphelidium protococcarum]KAI3653959.1 hypothetical protein MP228_000678 [Amoeboaphelidium protococcarum]
MDPAIIVLQPVRCQGRCPAIPYGQQFTMPQSEQTLLNCYPVYFRADDWIRCIATIESRGRAVHKARLKNCSLVTPACLVKTPLGNASAVAVKIIFLDLESLTLDIVRWYTLLHLNIRD